MGLQMDLLCYYFKMNKTGKTTVEKELAGEDNRTTVFSSEEIEHWLDVELNAAPDHIP